MESVKGGEKAGCHFDWAGLLTETVLLGNAAIRAGRRIEWDAARMLVMNNDAAQALIRPSYRSGWSLDAKP